MVLWERYYIAPLLGSIVALVGLLFVALAVDHLLSEPSDSVAIVLGGLVPVGLGLGVVAGGIRLSRTNVPPRCAVRVAGWWLFGMAVTATMGAAAVAYAGSHGVAFPDWAYVVTNNATAGALGGLVVGFYDARSRDRAAALETEREKLALVNRVLRHDVRNDLNVVLLRADLIEERLDGEALEHVRRLEGAAREAVDLTETTREFVEAVDRDDRELRPVDLRSAVEEQVQRARETHPEAALEVASVPRVAVLADDLLPALVRNLVSNAVQHNDVDEPRVRVDADVRDGSVVLRVADNGPGVPESRKEEVFGRDKKGPASGGSGIGLYLVDTLARDYGGEAWVEDNDPTGALFQVELQLAGDGARERRAAAESTVRRRAR